jgi:hypothetical protein
MISLRSHPMSESKLDLVCYWQRQGASADRRAIQIKSNVAESPESPPVTRYTGLTQLVEKKSIGSRTSSNNID